MSGGLKLCEQLNRQKTSFLKILAKVSSIFWLNLISMKFSRHRSDPISKENEPANIKTATMQNLILIL